MSVEIEELVAHLTSLPAGGEVVDLLREYGSTALSRNHFTPGHVTASGFVRKADRLLVIHHERLDRWLQPGGHVEPEDADIESAARREVEEETGLTGLASLGLLDVDIHQIPAARGEPVHLHFDVRWAFEATGSPRAGDGVSDARWATLSELEELGADESVTRSWRRLL